MEDASCQGSVLDKLRRYEADKNLVGAGTTTCSCRSLLPPKFQDLGVTKGLTWKKSALTVQTILWLIPNEAFTLQVRLQLNF